MLSSLRPQSRQGVAGSQWLHKILWVTILLSGFVSAADSVTYQDATTGFTFAQYSESYKYNNPEQFDIRVAVPSGASAPYDIVIQLLCPKDVGWLGVAWGGSMLSNPLTVAWPNGNSVTVSSRWATNRNQPQAYTGETLQVLTHGTSVNSSYWQVTMKCSGCTTWSSTGGSQTLSPTGTNRLAFAYSSTGPSTPSSNTSTFPVHNLFGYWDHDFSQGQNSDFSSLVTKNA